MVGKVPAFQPCGPGSILGGVTNFNFCLGTGCMFCVMSCVVPGDCTVHTFRKARPFVCLVFWSTVCCSLYRHLTHRHLDYKSRGGSRTLGSVETEKNKYMKSRTLFLSFWNKKNISTGLGGTLVTSSPLRSRFVDSKPIDFKIVESTAQQRHLSKTLKVNYLYG